MQKKFRFRARLDDGLFVVLIMAAAAASAALEAGALIGGVRTSHARTEAMARAQQASSPKMAIASQASSDDALVISAISRATR